MLIFLPIKIATHPPLLLSLRLKTWIVSPWCPAGSLESPINTNVPLLLSSPHRNTSTLFLRSKHLIVDNKSTLPAASRLSMILGIAKGTEPLMWVSEKSECALQSRMRSLLGLFCNLSSLKSHSGLTRSSSITFPPGMLRVLIQIPDASLVFNSFKTYPSLSVEAISLSQRSLYLPLYSKK